MRIVSAYTAVNTYIAAAHSHTTPDWERLWWDLAVAPHWQDWAAGQFNEARLREHFKTPILDLDGLEESVSMLSQSGVEGLITQAYAIISTALPSEEQDPAVCIFPMDPQNGYVRDVFHGVLGNGVGSNSLLQINPLGRDWRSYVPYVLAHEHHHSVWGYHYFYLQGHQKMPLLASLVCEGQADRFANGLFPGANPPWIQPFPEQQELELWARVRPCLAGDDPDEYARFMFRDEAGGIPANTGYRIGYQLVHSYCQSHPEIPLLDLIDISPEEILAGSRFANIL